MGVCSYVVIPSPGERDAVRRRLADEAACDVVPALVLTFAEIAAP
ncbi:MAG: hypothetical protein ACYC6F_17050 [Longimicrobiales bacterium]